jgi:hypothetical protein
LLGAETEDSLIYKLNSDKNKNNIDMIKNKIADFMIVRKLKKKWTGTNYEAIRPDLTDW